MPALPRLDLDTSPRQAWSQSSPRSRFQGDRPRRYRSWPLGLVLPMTLVLLWELLARGGVLAPNLMPAPTVVLATLVDLAIRGDLWQHLGITLYRVLLGFVIGGAVATVLGALTGYFPTARQLLDPTLQALRSIPSIAWVPLFILWLGIYEPSKIALIAVGVFFPIYLNLMVGIQQVDRKLVEVGRVYRLNQWQLIRRVFLPATLPCYLVGLRGGLGLGWMFVVAAELMGASRGLGFLLIDGQTTGRAAIIIASIFLFAILGKLTDSALARLTRHLLTWQDTHGSTKRT